MAQVRFTGKIPFDAVELPFLPEAGAVIKTGHFSYRVKKFKNLMIDIKDQGRPEYLFEVEEIKPKKHKKKS